MPPKKTAAKAAAKAAADVDAGGTGGVSLPSAHFCTPRHWLTAPQKLIWEGPNDLKVTKRNTHRKTFELTSPQLLLLTQGRYVKPEEYENLSKAIPGRSSHAHFFLH